MIRYGIAFILGLLALVPQMPLSADGNRESSSTLAKEPRNFVETLPDIEAVELAEGKKLSVIASTSIIGDVAAHVGSNAIMLTVLVGIGQDPHSYEPAPSDLAAVEKADVVLINGFGLEEALLSTIGATARGPVVPVSAGIVPVMPKAGESTHPNPHVWLDPVDVMVWVKNIESVLSRADPSNAALYHQQATAYLQQLTALDATMRKRFAEIPEEKRKLVTDHELFDYFATEYGFKVIGTILPSTSTSADTSARQVAKLVSLLRKESVTTIFVGITAGRSLRSLAESVSQELGHSVKIVGTLTGSLAEEGTSGDTYIGYMKYNMNQIVQGLTTETSKP